jgi:hypothetical protein
MNDIAELKLLADAGTFKSTVGEGWNEDVVNLTFTIKGVNVKAQWSFGSTRVYGFGIDSVDDFRRLLEVAK